MVERPPMPQAAGNCGHSECRCLVAPGEQYCSDYCAKAGVKPASGTGQPIAHKCQCGHPACA